MIAVVYMCRLNPHGLIPLVCIFMLISLSPQCFTLRETWDYVLFRGEQKDIPCLSGMHSLKRHVLPDQAKLQKWYSWVFFCSFALLFYSHHAGVILAGRLIAWKMAIFSKSHRWSMSSVRALSTLDAFSAAGYKILLQWLSIPNTAHIACKNILCCSKT